VMVFAMGALLAGVALFLGWARWGRRWPFGEA